MGCYHKFRNFFLQFQDKLTEIKDEWSKKEGKGYCDCKECTDDATVNFPSECPNITSECNRFVYYSGPLE
jgi:hypothetical protein